MGALSDEKDHLIETQKQVIGMLFEIVKRFQRNSDLDQEYFQIIVSGRSKDSAGRLTEIKKERGDNAQIIGRLLEQLDV